MKTTVFRESKRLSLDSTELVPGDIIYVQTGDRVPVDCIIFNIASEIKVDGSSLTGESDPFTRSVLHGGSTAETNPFDSPHVLFSGDIVLSGNFCIDPKVAGMQLLFLLG